MNPGAMKGMRVRRGGNSDAAGAEANNDEARARNRSSLDQPRTARLRPAAFPADMGLINARIRYEDEDTGERRVVTLVYPDTADERLARVSVLDPLGMALLGLREGESVDWPLQNGRRRRIRLLRVLPPLPLR
jgi:regulator of nucleoside diphosphate kinase